MAGVYRANLDLGKLRTQLFKADRVGRSNNAIEAWLVDRGFWRDGDQWLADASALAELPTGVVAARGKAVEPKPWRDDPIYALILRIADQECSNQKARWFVLIEEYVADSGGHCTGPVLRAWCRDATGLREITEPQRQERRRGAAGKYTWPFELVTFRIRPDGSRVVLGHRRGSTAGIGGEYLVQRTGQYLELVPDPNGNSWVS